MKSIRPGLPSIIGVLGHQSATGFQGTQGATGPGPQSSIYPQGHQGLSPQNFSGSQIPLGHQGATGSGPQSSIYPQGHQGLSPQNFPDFQIPIGHQGVTGHDFQGFQGLGSQNSPSLLIFMNDPSLQTFPTSQNSLISDKKIADKIQDSIHLSKKTDKFENLDTSGIRSVAKVAEPKDGRKGSIDDTHILLTGREQKVKSKTKPLSHFAKRDAFNALRFSALDLSSVRYEPKFNENALYATSTYITQVKEERPQQKYPFTEEGFKKYNKKEVAFISETDLFNRSKRYDDLPAVIDFMDQFLAGRGNKESAAFKIYQGQFARTGFDNEYGGFIVMPNPSYVPDKKNFFIEPKKIANETKLTGGFGLVSYWVPPMKYEGFVAFRALFPNNNFPGEVCDENKALIQQKRETIAEYKKRTLLHFITTPPDIKKDYLRLLIEFRTLVKKHLEEVYNVTEDTNTVEIYLHSPVYANDTALLHIHIRVNQARHQAEQDIVKLELDRLIEILESTNTSNENVRDIIINEAPLTAQKKIISLVPVGFPQEFQNGGVPEFTTKPNPWFVLAWADNIKNL